MKRRERGFSIVEVIIAAGLLSGLTLVFLRLNEQQSRSSKHFQQSMDILNIVNEIRSVLVDTGSCTETLAGMDAESTPMGESDSILNIKKRYISVKTLKPIVKEEFWISSDDKKNIYGSGRVSILGYELSSADDEVGIPDESMEGDTYLLIHFDKGKRSLGGTHLIRKIKLQVVVKDDKDRTIIRCQAKSGGKQSGISFTVLDFKNDATLQGKTGTEACKEKGLICSWVQSTNYAVSSSDGDIALACPSSYNISLDGVKGGSGLSNLHSCAAKLGVHGTLAINIGPQFVNCSGVFVAICN